MNAIKINTFQGMTLIELLIVLAIAGILMSTAVPSFSQMLSSSQQTAQLQRLFSHHQLARSEAIKLNSRVLLCKSSNGRECTRDSLWSDGWIIFSDKDKNNKLSDNEQILWHQSQLHDGLTLLYRGFGSHNYVRYYPDGHSSTNGTFILCTQLKHSHPRGVIISRTGRMRMASESSEKNPLTCS